jgi:hypothetical protein
MKRLLPLFALALAAPAAAQRGAPESISFHTGACFGTCPVFTVTVRSDGSGTFQGVNFTAVRGTRNFRITPLQYRAFAAHLAPLRPAQGSADYEGPPRCRSMATDLPSAGVIWTDRRGEQHLSYYYGCDMEKNRALAQRLSSAPGLLPIGDFIGRRR